MEEKNMEPVKISRTLLKRLPIYLNYLKTMPGQDCNVSATAIANALGLGHVQVRKDLAKISIEGRRRTGRSRDQLIRDIEKYLDFTSATTTIVVGGGPLGQALLDYTGFAHSGLNVMACFDPNPAVKRSGAGKPIYSMNRLASFCKCYDVRIGIIAVEPECAQSVCDGLVDCGIQAIWNFAPVSLKVPKDVVLQNENLAVSVSALRMQLKNREADTPVLAAAGLDQ